MKSIRSKGLILTVAMGALLAGPASAQFVTKWSYTSDLNFLTSGPAPQFVAGATGSGGETIAEADEISWGLAELSGGTFDPANGRSALTTGNHSCDDRRRPYYRSGLH